MNLILLLLILPPLFLMTVLMRDKTRTLFLFIMYGIFAAFFAGQINSVILSRVAISDFYLSIHVSPATEELIKAFPLILYLYAARPGRLEIAECAVATGLGFAFFENAWAFATSISAVPGWNDIAFALSRGFGASMVHSLCSLILVLGIATCMKTRKLVVSGSVALFSLVVILHSLFNVLVQSPYTIAPFLLTLGTYAVIAAVFLYRKKRKKADAPSEKEVTP